LLERQLPVRDESNELVTGRRAHVGQLLLLGRVHVQVVGPRILPDDHSFVDQGRRPDEQRAPLLQIEQRVGRHGTRPIGDQRTCRTRAQLAHPGHVSIEYVMQEAGAAGFGQELGPESDQPARRHLVFHANPSAAMVDQLRQRGSP
jgi:hypothetical protein